jgi:hypothetical protein
VAEVRIIIRRGKRLDLKAELSLYDPGDERERRWNFLVGPRQEDVDREVYRLKDQMERAGNHCTVVELRA